MNKRPILITGAHRSGSTWVGNMTGASDQVCYLWEPFNFHFGPGVCNAPFEYHFPYVNETNEDKYIDSIRRTLNYRYHLMEELRTIKSGWQLKKCIKDFARFQAAKIKKQRPLFKDPIAIFSAQWLAQRFDFQVVILLRHPAAFVNSLNRLDWNYNFNELLKQPHLLDGPLAPFKEQVKDHARNPRDITGQAILLWNLFYSRVKQYRDAHPDWLYLRHEDIAREPVPAFKNIFRYLDLPFTSAIENNIIRHSNIQNPTSSSGTETSAIKMNSGKSIHTWRKQLTPETIERIEDGTREIARHFYSEEDWARGE